MATHKSLAHEEDEGEWHDGLFGCFSNCEICFMGMCCPCVRWGKTLEKAKLWDFAHACALMAAFVLIPNIVGQVFRDVDSNTSHANINQGVSAVCQAIISYMVFMYRRKIVEKYNISEGQFCSCLSAFFCWGLAICQEARHIEAEGDEGDVEMQ